MRDWGRNIALTGTLLAVVAVVGVYPHPANAFFTDTEVSTGNSLVAGGGDVLQASVSSGSAGTTPAPPISGVDLKIDSTGYYNGVFNASTTWALTNLTNQKFFVSNDVKPGDLVEDTTSLHVSNDAYMCMNVHLTSTPENGLTGPEVAAGDVTDGPSAGELQNHVSFVFWADDGDNVYEQGEHIFKQGLVKDIFNGQNWTLADSAANIWGDQGPLLSGVTKYIGQASCVGTITPTPVVQDGAGNLGTNGPAVRGSGFTCDGGQVGNDIQTDGVTFDMTFQAIQARNNTGFLCSSTAPPPPSQPPVADFTYSPQNPEAGQSINFDASNSHDSSGQIVNYEWDWNSDGQYEEQSSSPQAIFAWPFGWGENGGGTFTVTLKIVDSNGQMATTSKQVVFAPSPTSQVSGLAAANMANVNWNVICESSLGNWLGSLIGLCKEYNDFLAIDKQLTIDYDAVSDTPGVAPTYSTLGWLQKYDTDHGTHYYNVYTVPDFITILNNQIDASKAPGITYKSYLLSSIYEENLINFAFKHPTPSYPIDILAQLFSDGMMSMATGMIQDGATNILQLLTTLPVDAGSTAIDFYTQLGGDAGLYTSVEKDIYKNALGSYLLHRSLGDGESGTWTNFAAPVFSDLSQQTQSSIRTYFYALNTEYNTLPNNQRGLPNEGLTPAYRQQNAQSIAKWIISALETYKNELPDRSYSTPHSPVQLHVTDSNGKITGLVNGVTMDEIPNSAYDPTEEKVLIFNPQSMLHYVVVGTASGTYGLTIDPTISTTTTDFLAFDIPIIPNAIHTYTLDESALEKGKDGVTLQIDQNGNGKTISTSQVGAQFTDTIAPTTIIAVSGTTWRNGWYVGTTTVAFTAHDNQGGVGVQKTEYSLNGNNTLTTYASTSPLVITAEGTTTITYRSADFLGNTEIPKTLATKIVSVMRLLEDASAKLSSIHTGNKDIDTATASASKNLGDVVSDKAWIDRNHLLWPSGLRTLVNEISLASTLDSLNDKAAQKKNIIPVATAALYRDAQNDFVQSNALLAKLSFDKAKTVKAKNAVERKTIDTTLANIQKMLDRAAGKETASPIQAMQLYGSAWFASEALLKRTDAATLRANDLESLYDAADMKDLMN